MRLVPDLRQIEATAQSNAERKVARLLQHVVRDDACAYYSKDLRKHSEKQDAEADFVILWDGAIIVIEVKGGGIEQIAGRWYTTDRHGHRNPLHESPMKQARAAKHALLDILKDEKVGWVRGDHMVITPDILKPPSSIEWEPWQWLARESMEPEALADAFESLVRRIEPVPRGVPAASPKALRRALEGEFRRMPVVDLQRGEVLAEQVRATKEQAAVLAGLTGNDRIFVTGGAGTGKSLLLATAARDEADQGRSVLVTFRSPDLKKYFDLHIESAAIDVVPFADLDAAKAYDVALVDEAQDLMTAEDMDRLDAVIKGGRSAGRWRMFLDPNNQAHVDGDYDPDVVALVESEATTFHLGKNVRNTAAMVHTVQDYLHADVGDPGIVIGKGVGWHKVEGGSSTSRAAHLAKAEEIAESLVLNGADRRSIWIVDFDPMAERRTTDRGITVTSPRFAKGLEADHVIVAGLPDDMEDAGLAAFYVAITRARVTLQVVVDRKERMRLLELTGVQRP